MNWIQILSKKDVDYLNDAFDNFHDSCIKEICFSSGSYVKEDLSMHAISKPVARILFQRQWENPSVIELEFRDVLQMNIRPEGEDEFTNIMIARLYFDNGIFFWNARDYEFHEAGKDNHTWIAAKYVQWRVRDDLKGSNMIYMGE